MQASDIVPKETERLAFLHALQLLGHLPKTTADSKLIFSVSCVQRVRMKNHVFIGSQILSILR